MGDMFPPGRMVPLYHNPAEDQTMTMLEEELKLPCPYCKHDASYTDARTHSGEMTRCSNCNKRITWTLPFMPPGRAYWAKTVIVDRKTGRVIGIDDN